MPGKWKAGSQNNKYARPGATKAAYHKTTLVKALIFSPPEICWYYIYIHVYFSVKNLNGTIFRYALVLYLISGTSLPGFLFPSQNIFWLGTNDLWVGNKWFPSSMTTKVSFIRPGAESKMSRDFFFFPLSIAQFWWHHSLLCLTIFILHFGPFSFNGDYKELSFEKLDTAAPRTINAPSCIHSNDNLCYLRNRDHVFVSHQQAFQEEADSKT